MKSARKLFHMRSRTNYLMWFAWLILVVALFSTNLAGQDNASLTITSGSTLPAAAEGSPYSQTLTAAGGTLPYSWSIAAGSLPGGLELFSTTGVISGNPSTSGTFNFTVRVSDGSQPAPQTATKDFSLLVFAAPPVLISIDPSAMPAGSPAFTLTVNGTNFVSGSTVRWNGANRTTTFVNSSQLTAAIPASDIATSGTASITVLNPGPTSNALTFTILPVLTITTSPSLPQGTVGTPYSQTLTAAGGTVPYSWSIAAGALPGGLALSSSTGVISGSPSTSGTFNFTVRVSDGGQPTPQTATRAFSLVVSVAAPVLSSINPSTVPAGSPAFTLTVNGSNFGSGSTVRWNGSNRTTTFVSVSQLTAAISASDVASRGAATVTVADPVGGTSNTLTFTVSPPVLNITTSSLPSGVVGLGYSQTLSATGGQPPYSWSVVAGSLPAGLALAPSTGVLSGTPSAAGTANFTVRLSDDFQPTPQTTTRAFSLVVSVAAPVLSSINPSTVPAGSPAFTLTVNGSNFGSGSTVRWNGSNRTTTFISVSQLTAAISASDVASRGAATVTVADPVGGTSNALTFTVSPPVLNITTESLPSGVVGLGYSQTLSATGGQQPYSWSVVAGSLPAGLALAPSTGVLSGTPSAAGTANFTVRLSDDFQPTPQTTTRIFSLTVTAAPAPVLNSLNPSAANAGGPAFTLTVNGSNFLSNSTVIWNGVNRTTTFVSGSQLTAAIPATDIATAGTASVTVVTPGGTASNALTFTISASNVLTITTGSPLPQGTVASAYSQTLAASGGTPPYSWSVSAGSLPTGLNLNASSGAISGTPTTVGNPTFTVRVADSASGVATKQFQLLIGSTTIPTPTITGVSGTVEPAQQPSIEITLPSPHPSPITGQLTLRFTSNADVASDDPSIQFSTGGRTVNFSIPANATRAVFSNGAPNIAFQTGTVSGTIELAVSGQSGGSPATPLPPVSQTLTLSRRSPAITRLNIATRSASGFELAVTGFSTPRSLTQVTCNFIPAQGANLQTSTVTLGLTASAATWFQSQTSATLGGQFRLLIPFTVQGELTAIQSVSVTLTNGEGTSTASSVQF